MNVNKILLHVAYIAIIFVCLYNIYEGNKEKAAMAELLKRYKLQNDYYKKQLREADKIINSKNIVYW